MPESLKAVELEPNNAEYHFGLGVTLIFLGQWDEGLTQMETAAKLDSAYEEDYQFAYQFFLSLLKEAADSRKTSFFG